MADDKFIVTSLKDSKKINRVLANDTARQIMELLAEKRMSAAEIAEKMKLPLTTVDYSLKNLEAVGLVKTKTGFNKNTRVVKYYEPQEKFIVIAPRSAQNTLSILKSLIPLFFLIAVLSFGLESVRIPVYQEGDPSMASSTIAPMMVDESQSRKIADDTSESFDQRIAQESVSDTMIAQETAQVTYVNPHYGLVFGPSAALLIVLYALWRGGMFRKFS